MTLLFLLISLGVIWVNLVGLGLACMRLTGDYAVARIAGILGICLVFFSIEHFHGFGPRLWILPFSTTLSVWLAWRDFDILRKNAIVEAAFGVGVLYLLAWRYTFPDIDLFGERIPDLVFIQDYAMGRTLPPPDRWMPPFNADFYYSFQFYSAALMGRWFRFGPNIAYQLAYCIVSGFITCAMFTAARRFCSWKPGAWIVSGALLVGGCGLGLVIHLAMRQHYIQPEEISRYLGIVWSPDRKTSFGHVLDRLMYQPDTLPLEMPVEPMSFVLTIGEFHPPLTGFLVLMFSLLLIATLDGEESPARRRVYHALLAATVPFSLIGNTWVFPLQTIVVALWFIHRALSGEKDHWLAGFFGAGVTTALAYPFIVNFVQESAVHTTSIRITPAASHATVVEWLSVFWPLVALLVLAAYNREKQRLCLYFVCVWVVLLVCTELFFNHDVFAGTRTWARYNSTLKWWGWLYTAGVLSLGALNLGSRSRLCRYGSIVALLLPCAQALDYAWYFVDTPKNSMGHLDGTYWLTKDDTIRDMVTELKALPDGICLDSGLTFDNTDATVIPIFGEKECYMGWPVQEGTWRQFRMEIRLRVKEVNDFYAGRMDDPMGWLLKNNVRYVMWLQRDNDHANERFVPLWNKIRSRYVWHHYAGTDTDWAVGFWERIGTDGMAR